MNKKKQRKLQAIPGNGKGQNIPAITMTITLIAGRVSVSGFPNDLRTALDILHEAAKAIVNHFMGALLNQSKTNVEEPKKREYMGVRPN